MKDSKIKYHIVAKPAQLDIVSTQIILDWDHDRETSIARLIKAVMRYVTVPIIASSHASSDQPLMGRFCMGRPTTE